MRKMLILATITFALGGASGCYTTGPNGTQCCLWHSFAHFEDCKMRCLFCCHQPAPVIVPAPIVAPAFAPAPVCAPVAAAPVCAPIAAQPCAPVAQPCAPMAQPCAPMAAAQPCAPTNICAPIECGSPCECGQQNPCGAMSMTSGCAPSPCGCGSEGMTLTPAVPTLAPAPSLAPTPSFRASPRRSKLGAEVQPGVRRP